MKRILRLLLFALLLITIQCRTVKPLPRIADGKKLLQYERTACFGFCPVYSVTLLKNGQVYFIGKRFVPYADTITFKLQDNQLRRITQIMTHPEYQNMEADTSDTQVMDAPRLLFEDFSNARKFDTDIRTPAPISEITEQIDSHLKEKKLLYGSKDPLVRQEIIISLRPGTDPLSVTGQHYGFELEYIKEIGENIHLYTILTAESFMQDAMIKLKSKETIREVQKNHPLERRGNSK